MPKTIRKEYAIKTTWMILNGLGYTEEDNAQLAATVKAIFDTTPTTDAVHVVRCRDCIHWGSKDKGMDWLICPYDGDTGPDWFCADGERREE